MKNRFCVKRIFLLAALLSLAAGVWAQAQKFQMRAVWIATVANIDWPSCATLTAEQQQAELTAMLDKLQSLNVNAVVFQIRPAADAFFVSPYEPWSVWLGGAAPSPFYDPLDFLVKEAHSRCMEVHAWLNPYRVSLNDTDKLCEAHPLFTKAGWVKKYGGRNYFDPGREETQAYLKQIVADVVMRYDVDAIHFDDYFYPYRIPGAEFPDDDTFRANPRGFAPDERDAWRRDNVTRIVAALHDEIKKIKPWVDFGISPFGVWRNAKDDARGSKTSAGMTNYDDLYADVDLWLKDGIIDYVVPQLYWEIGKEAADYRVLIDWWSRNSYGRNLYIGLFASGLNASKSPAWRKGNELARQLSLNRNYPQQQGVFLYSARPLLRNPLGICDTLRHNYFRFPSLVPACKSVVRQPSEALWNLRVLKNENSAYLLWDAPENLRGGDRVSYFVVYAFAENAEPDFSNPENIAGKSALPFFEIPEKFRRAGVRFSVTAVDRFRTESEPCALVGF